MALVAWPSLCSSASLFPDTFDDAFEDATEQWLPGTDWRRLKAQCYQESLLDPLAESHVGAQGLCQFMPGTWRDVSADLALTASPFVPDASIHAAAYYMRRLIRGWSSPRPAEDRRRLAEASYNAGFGNLLAAQRRCHGAALYAEIVACLPQVTGKHADETTTYVERIQRWYRLMRMTT